MMIDVDRLVNPHLIGINTYKGVDPPEALAARAGIREDQIVRLNGNENPYGGSPRASEALAALPLHIYPDPFQRKIRRGLAEYVGIDEAHIIAGAGSDELIDLVFRLFISSGDIVIDLDPTFGMYAFCARVAGVEIRTVPRDGTFEINVEAVERATDSKAKIVFVNSPNNPTGNLATEGQLRSLLETGLMVVVDEAYYEFCGETAAGLIPEYENLVVLRTFSKWAGIAGLRVGYGIMSPRIVKHIIDIKSPYNVSTAAEVAALASLDDADALLQNVKLIVSERERMFALLKGISGLKPWPSRGNYILGQCEAGRARAIFEDLAKRGIFVRRFSSERLNDFFRISVGTPEQTDAVIHALTEVV